MSNVQWEAILGIFRRLTDIEYQKEEWVLHKNLDAVYGYAEAVNTLGDYGFFDIVEYNEMGFSEEDLAFLDAYVQDLLEYGSETEPYLMLKDPKWLDLVERGKRVTSIIKSSI